MITNNIQYTPCGSSCSAQFNRGDLERNLAIACEKGDVGSVQGILRKGLNPNFQTTEGATPLILASLEGHIDVISWLLAYEANVDMQDGDGWTALMFAARKGHIEIMKALLAKKADMDVQDKDGWTALMQAAYSGRVEVVQELLVRKANVDRQDKDGWTALLWAAYNGRVEVVQELLANGASIDMHDNDGRTALLWASYNGHTEIVKALLTKKADIGMWDKRGLTALMAAVKGGHIEVVKELLAYEAGVDMQDNDGRSALILAATRGDIEISEVLLKHGADVCIVNRNGKNMLLILRETSPDGYKRIKAGLAPMGGVEKYNKFHRKVQNVCHIYGIEGTSRFKTDQGSYIVFRKLGVYDKYYASMFAKNLGLFSEKIADETVQEAMGNICSMLTKHAGSAHVSSDELAKQYVQGTPILVSGGFVGHQVVYCFWKTHCILVNRGAGSRNPIEIFSIEEKTCTDHAFFVRLLSKIRQIQESGTETDFEKFLDDEFQQPQYLPRIALESFLESKLALLPQTVGNCGFASVEGAVFALLALEALSAEEGLLSQGECDRMQEEKIQEIVKSQREIFDKFSAFLKERYVKKYLGVISLGRPDPDILYHVFES